MCAETDPADCHRSHISDWLVAQGARVVHLLGAGKVHEHTGQLFQPRKKWSGPLIEASFPSR